MISGSDTGQAASTVLPSRGRVTQNEGKFLVSALMPPGTHHIHRESGEKGELAPGGKRGRGAKKWSRVKML